MSGKLWVNEQSVQVFTYDFAELGGAVSAISLGNLPDNFIVKDIALYVDTTITSAGTPTLVIGEDGGGDADGYFADFFGTPTAGAAVKASGALISDAFHKVDSAKDGLVLTIGTAAVTARKFRVFVTGVQV
jgi:hypothetical protein